MHELDRHRALADGGGDALHRACVDIADGKDAELTRLEEERSLTAERLGLDIAPGEQEAVLVHRNMAAQPVGVRLGANEHEERFAVDLALRAVQRVADDELLEPLFRALELDHLGVR